MPHLVEAVQLPVLVGQRDDDLLEPLRPALVRLVRPELGESRVDVGLELGIADDGRAAAEERVIREAGIFDRLDELRPDLVMSFLVLRLGAGPDLEGETESFHVGSPCRNRYRDRMLS